MAAWEALPKEVAGQMGMALVVMEMANRDQTGNAEFVGDFRNGYIDFGWDKFDEETKLQKRGIELNNGRAAMMGILGLMVHEELNGEPYIINALCGQPSNFNAGL